MTAALGAVILHIASPDSCQIVCRLTFCSTFSPWRLGVGDVESDWGHLDIGWSLVRPEDAGGIRVQSLSACGS